MACFDGRGRLAVACRTFAQNPAKVWRIGLLLPGGKPASIDTHVSSAFLRGLRELGYAEGKNLIIEWRFADGKYDLMTEMAADLVRLGVDVIATAGTPASTAAKNATVAIPVVMMSLGDPVGAGLVKSLARPGGNVTGLSNFTGDLSPKHLEMLLAFVPNLGRMAVLINPDNPNHATILQNVQAAGQKLRVAITPREAKTSLEIDTAFAAMQRDRAGGVLVAHDGFYLQQRRQIAALAQKHRLPAIFLLREYVEAGGLMSYGASASEQYRRAAYFVDRILRRTKPADLPIEQPMRFELAINRKTVKALGLTIPQSLSISATEMIE